MKKILLFNISVFVLIISAHSQSVTITPEHTSGTCSDYVVFFNGEASGVATSFNFNGGSLPQGWTASDYAISSTTCPGKNSPDNSNYFWAIELGTTAPYIGKRFVQTNAVDVSSGGYIKFYIRYGADEGSGCEDPDLALEEVILSYSLDGGSTWITIFEDWNTVPDKSAAWYNWYWNDIAIPENAKSPATIFRWYQPSNSSASNDNWGLEDVSIGTNITPVSYKWFVNGTQVATTEDLTYTFPSATTYTVRFDVLFSDGITRSATTNYQVLPNQTPTLSTISNRTIPMNSGQITVSLYGIGDGDCVAQGLSLSTATANASLIPTPTYSYASPNSSGTLYFTPAPNQVGNVQLTATVTDDAANSYGSALSISRNFNVYVNDYPTNPGAFTQPTGDKLNIDYLYDIGWGASTDQTASVTYYLEYMLNGESWTSIDGGIPTNSYQNWGGHQSVALGRTVQFRVMAYDGTYTSGYTYSSTYEITDNEPPVANNISYKRFYTDTQKVFSVNAANGVLSNDTDPDNDTPLYVADPRTNARLSYGYLTLNTDGSFTYTSDDGQKDINDTFTYYANDGQENSVSPATVTIEILTPRFTNANGTGMFSDPANWNCGYVPNVESLNIIIAANMQLQVDQDYTCKNLKFESGASFNCISGHKLTINDDILRHDGSVAIEVDSPIVVSTSISINNQ